MKESQKLTYENKTLIKSLSGHSGCDVALFYDHAKKRKFVRKKSSSGDYNNRLLLQMTKQNAHNSRIIHRPAVYTHGYDKSGLLYYDMEFIMGRRLDDLHMSIDCSLVDKIFDNVIRCYEDMASNSQTVDCSTVIFEKISDLKKKSVFKEEKIAKYFDLVLAEDWNIPTGQLSHGDLTFENIIYADNKIYFIDFLDSFLETYLIDISKIIFDLRYFWSWRNLKRKPIVRNIFVLRKIEKTNLYLEYKSAINKLVLLHILRILPYAKSKENINYLIRCLENEKQR